MRSIAKKINGAIIAELYAMELLELLRSFKTPQLTEYLKTNPCSISGCNGGPPCAGCAPYYFCSHINLLDRQNSTNDQAVILNPDPLADLPNDFILHGNSNTHLASRFYQIQIMNMATLKQNESRCAQNAISPGFSLDPDERFVLTVGLSWIPLGEGLENAKRVVLTSLLPTNP